MASTVLKTTIRNLYREKIYAVINIAGLSLAIACCLILGLYLRSELTYDQHNPKYKQIYRVVNEYNVNGKPESFAQTSQLLGPMLKSEYAEVKDYVRFLIVGQEVLMESGDKAFYWKNNAFANKDIFKYFKHEFIYGDPETALQDPGTAVVSESLAKKYWGNENPIGKLITSENNTAKVTHVFADLPPNSHLKYDILMSEDNPLLADPEETNARLRALASISRYTYLIMPEDYDIKDFKKISDSFNKRNMEEVLRGSNITWKAWLQPLASIHYHSDVDRDEPTGNKTYLYGFTAVAIFILLVACINYMNLATARATKRAKEIGMQKILGSGRTRLIFQFMTEAVSFSLLALVFGYILLQVAMYLTPINELLGNSIALKDLTDPYILIGMLVFSMLLGLVSGIYPAIYLSSVLPLSALVGGQQAGKGSIRLRQILVLIQFIISVCVIACTMIMTMQMKYVSNKALGFEKNNRLLITLRTADVIDKVETIKKELLKNSGVLGVSVCNQVLGNITSFMVPMVDNNEGTQDRTSIMSMQVGNDFMEVMGIKLKEGRDLSKKLITDVGNSFIVNETLVKKMGWDQPLGKHIGDGRVIGVVEDFHYGSLHKSVEPFLLQRFPPNTNDIPPNQRNLISRYMVVNLAGDSISQTLSFIEDKLAELDPKHPFEFEFQDDSLNKLYKDEQRQMKLIGIFAVVCIFISCMGLFGLAAFTTEQRTKEIGIRKVIGASTWQIITMLAQSILLLVLVGAVIASAIAYYSMSEYWLIDFAYRINLNTNIWVFLVAACLAAAVAFTTIALQSFKTAQANPIDALRYE